MKTEICLHCHAPIPDGACQQGQLIDGKWHPLHVGCAEEWCSEPVEVWTIHSEDYGYTSDRESVLAEIDHLEVGQSLTVTKREMERLKYLTLPEANI